MEEMDDGNIRNEVAEILLEALGSTIEKAVTDALPRGALQGDIGDRDSEKLDVSGLEYIVEFFRGGSEHLQTYGTISVEASFLLKIASSVILARQSFVDMDTAAGKNAIAQLKEISEEFALPDCLEDEVRQMDMEISYRECMDKMKKSLLSSEPIQYLSSAVKTRKRTVSTGKVHNASILATGQGGAAGFTPMSEAEEVIAEEDLMLNEAALDIRPIDKALQQASQLQDLLESEELPEEFFHFISALEAIKKLREAVKKFDWTTAVAALGDIERENLTDLVPDIAEEVKAATEPVQNFAVVTACKLALVKGQPTGSTGLLDFKSMSLDQLEEAARLCEAVGCHSARAEELYKAVQVITALRRAQQMGDWDAVRAALKRAEAEEIGSGATSLCIGEINRSMTERDNYEHVDSLKGALIKEEVLTKESLLDLDNATVNELSAVYAKANNFPDDTRGPVLKTLMSLAEVVLKLRRAAIQKQWFLVESLLPVVKDYIESFHNDVEKADRVISQRKTVSFRSSAVFRGSMLARPGSGSNMQVPPEGAAAAPSPGSPLIGGKPAVWDEFTALSATIKREIRSFDNHFVVLKLEADFGRLLKENGIQSEVIGSIDMAAIKVEGLSAALQVKAELESAGLTLPEAVQKLGRIAHLVVEVRLAVLANKWDSISAMLEETLNGGLGTLPEYTRGEILIVRRELENRWIITNLQIALQTGKLEGDLGKANLGNVSCEQLMSYISTVKSLNPRTEFALLLLYTAESVCPLRKLMCESEVDWPAVLKLAKKLLLDVERRKIHTSVLPELRLVQATSEDTILCNAMLGALRTGGISGQPGEVDPKTINVQALEAANKLVARSTVKTEAAAQLSNACRAMQTVRETLLRLLSTTEDHPRVWTTVQSYLAAIAEARRKQPADQSWESCSAELDLLTKHVHIEEVKSRLQECASRTSHTYALRAKAVDVAMLEQTVAGSAEAKNLYCGELDAIIEFAKTEQFESEFLDRFVGCATTLRLLRSSIVKDSWDALEELLGDPSVRHNLKILNEAEQELAWVACELHNHRAVEILAAALKASSCVGDEQVEAMELILSVEDYSANNHVLEQALQGVKKYKITSAASTQLLECCKNVLQLRQSLKNSNNEMIAASLRWFQSNFATCPAYILKEVQQIYVLHQNNLLSKSLTAALAVGKALGPCGELRLENIQTDHLENLLMQAADIEPKFSNVEELCEAGAVAVSIRLALRDYDLPELTSIIDELSDREHFHLLVVDEIATARGEVDNDVSTRALMDSLKSFDEAESKAMDLTFMNSGGGGATSTGGEESSDKSPRPGFSILQTFSERRYSFANKSNANIDPETIDIDVLDQGLRIADDHGVYSTRARALYRTVQLVKSLRVAMKNSEWPRLEEILSQANYEENIGVMYDAAATKEIQALTSQLEMRAAIVDLSKALKVGWAKCSTGIVDTSTLSNDLLESAIDRANRSITELSAGLANDSNEEDSEDDSDMPETANFSPDANNQKRRVSFVSDEIPEKPVEEKTLSLVQKQVDLLMESARLVLRIREILLAGDMQKAGILAEEALNGKLHYAVVDELKHYSKEINSALSTMKIIDALREGIQAGSVERLADLINTAKSSDSNFSNDLGLIRTLDRAETVYYSLLDIRKRATALSDVYDTEALRCTIDQAVKYNMAEKELEQTRSRLDKLLAFEALVNEVTQRSHGVLSDTASLELILKHAAQLNLSRHPLAKSADLRLRFLSEAFRTVVIAEGVVKRNLYVIATETIRLKHHYLQLPSSVTKYALENFPNLRRPQDFGVRMNIASEELRRTMMVHSDQPLPTSLTKLSPVLAALSVTIFTQYVRGIERSMYTDFGVVLRRLLALGRMHPPMRDEILLLIIKQMRHNLDVDAATRLWKTLSACLYHFPPSLLFESYLEQYLIQSGTDSAHFIGYTQRSIRFMHQSIIRFGYTDQITADFVSTLDEMRLWFQEGIYDPTTAGQAVPAAPKARRESAADAAEGSLEGTDPAFMAIHDKKSRSASIHGHAQTASHKASAGTEEVRGTKEDWIARFRLFNHDLSSKEGGHMTKQKFAAAIAASITPDSKIDQFDRDVFYFMLFGKHVSNARAVVREHASADILFHSTSEDEIGASQARRQWLDANMPIIDKSSELFFSQLKGPDLGSYAERFWDNIVEKMSAECMHFPFLKWEGDERRKPSIKNGGSDVTINWELYREIVLTGMKKCIDRAKSLRSNVAAATHEDFKLTGFTMHHVDLHHTRGK